MIFVWWWCRPVEAHQERHVRMRDVIWQLTHARRPILLLYMIQVMMTALVVGLQFLLPEFCQQNNYPEFIQYGGSLFLLIAGSVMMMVPVGHIADRFGRKRTLNTMLAMTLVCYTTMVMIPDLPLWQFCILCVLIGGFSMAGGPIVIAMAQQLAPKSESMISGVVMGLAWALGSVSTAIVGVLAEQKGIGVLGALQWMILAAVFALPLGWMLPKVPISHD
jgi:MFS family permease